MSDTLQGRIDELVKQHGGLRPAARALQIDLAYMQRLRSGEKSNPGPKVLRKLGLRKVVEIRYYVRSEP